jgi:hypothetical protein
MAEPCGEGEVASCSNLTIGPVNIYSDYISADCAADDHTVLIEGGSFAKFGYIQGADKTVQANPIHECGFGQIDDVTFVPFVEYDGNYSRLYITAFAQNSPQGGYYGIILNARFT